MAETTVALPDNVHTVASAVAGQRQLNTTKSAKIKSSHYWEHIDFTLPWSNVTFLSLWQLRLAGEGILFSASLLIHLSVCDNQD